MYKIIHEILYTEYGWFSVALIVIFSSVCFDYAVKFLFSINLSWSIDLLVGLIFGWLLIPVAFICMLLSICGISPPLIQL